MNEFDDLEANWPLVPLLGLPRASTCVIVGAYQGKVMEWLIERQGAYRVIGFEPQRWAVERAIERLRGRPEAIVVPYGLGDKTGELGMGEFHTDAASFVNTGPGSRERGAGYVVAAERVWDTLRIGAADLLVMNIEGYEYKLLPYMLDKGLHYTVDRIAVQFHTDFGHESEYRLIKMRLDETHNVVDDWYPNWVYWTR